MRSAGLNQIGAPVARRRSTAALMWSLCPWVSTIALTRRPPMAATIGAASCGASMTRTSSSSPTSQTLLSTSKSCPSRLKTPLTTAWSMRALTRPPRRRSSEPRAALLYSPVSSRARSLVHHHDRAQHLALAEVVEGLLDVVQADGLGDELVEREAALQVEVDEHREVAAGQAVAVPGGLDRAAPAEDLDGRELDRHVGGGDADHDDAAGQVAGVEGLLEHLRVADRVDGDVHPEAPGEALDRLDRVGLPGVDRVGCAELPGPLQLP